MFESTFKRSVLLYRHYCCGDDDSIYAAPSVGIAVIREQFMILLQGVHENTFCLKRESRGWKIFCPYWWSWCSHSLSFLSHSFCLLRTDGILSQVWDPTDLQGSTQLVCASAACSGTAAGKQQEDVLVSSCAEWLIWKSFWSYRWLLCVIWWRFQYWVLWATRVLLLGGS